MSNALVADGSFLLDLYARYRRDPLSVPADWRVEFETGDAPSASAELAQRLRDAYQQAHPHAGEPPLETPAESQPPQRTES